MKIARKPDLLKGNLTTERLMKYNLKPKVKPLLDTCSNLNAAN